MEIIVTIFRQVVIMFLLSGVGYLMFRGKKISLEGSRNLGNILLYLSLPCVIINGFLVEKTPERLAGLGISAVMALIILLASMLLSRLILGRNAIENFAGAFSNPGFFGVPLITSTLSNGAVFYIAAFIAFLNLLQWTYGVSLLERADEQGNVPGFRENSGNTARKADFRKRCKAMAVKLIKAPFMIAILIGLFFFLTGIPMPSVAGKCIGYIADLNTPLAMFTIGIYLAQTDALKMFGKPRLYLVSVVRMIACPLAAMLLLGLVPDTLIELKIAILIASACPVGSNVAVYAQLHDSDYACAVETVAFSTILSIVTLPLIIGFAWMVW